MQKNPLYFLVPMARIELSTGGFSGHVFENLKKNALFPLQQTFQPTPPKEHGVENQKVDVGKHESSQRDKRLSQVAADGFLGI